MTVTDIALLTFAVACFVPSLQRRLGWAIGGFKREFAGGFEDGKKATKVEVETVEESK